MATTTTADTETPHPRDDDAALDIAAILEHLDAYTLARLRRQAAGESIWHVDMCGELPALAGPDEARDLARLAELHQRTEEAVTLIRLRAEGYEPITTGQDGERVRDIVFYPTGIMGEGGAPSGLAQHPKGRLVCDTDGTILGVLPARHRTNPISRAGRSVLVLRASGHPIPLPERPGDLELLYNLAEDSELPMLDALARRAGLRWDCQAKPEHPHGPWTNVTGEPCDRCGRSQTEADAYDVQ